MQQYHKDQVELKHHPIPLIYIDFTAFHLKSSAKQLHLIAILKTLQSVCVFNYYEEFRENL